MVLNVPRLRCLDDRCHGDRPLIGFARENMNGREEEICLRRGNADGVARGKCGVVRLATIVPSKIIFKFGRPYGAWRVWGCFPRVALRSTLGYSRRLPPGA